MSELDDRLLDLVEGITDEDQQRLPLLTLREAQAAVELLQLLADTSDEGACAARHLAGRLARRLPAET
ncbi:hypothetical protein [Streptomyces bugieae]|uniref:Uncharacterized protein n=1 Tax=Streptomyces bugieae TaxID=3098223 RepID=A0ABU7NL10_9ACTN|nr:hypothetical protein [Streptomyces sp. DSM 41528]